MIENLVLITSVINTPFKPLSYSNIRSIYTTKQRFEQTLETIKTVKEKIPNSKLLIIECSNFKEEYLEYEKFLLNNCNYFINLYDNEILRNDIYGISKSLGEGTMTIEGLKFINDNNIIFNNLFKISGRYWLSDKFDYNNFSNNFLIFKKINNKLNNIFTALYKINYETVEKLLLFLKNNNNNMKNCIGYEVLFAKFLNEIGYNKIIFLDIIGLQGFVTIDGSYYNG